MEIKARKNFLLTEYGEDWCRIEYDGKTGYVKNNFQTKLKLPEDPTAVPYECKSNFQLSVYTTPTDYSNDGEVFYTTLDSIEVIDGQNGLVVTKEGAQLRNIPSDKAFIFGTNNIGQDLWARVWSGTRTSLWIGFVVAFFEALIGIMVGILWGYVRQLDRLITEIYNVIDNIPNTIILILISYIMRPSISTLIFAMSLTRWLGMARFIRNQIVIIRDRDYNLASRCLGTSTTRIMIKNLLPYLVSVIMLRMALAIPNAIGSEVFITYIGLGLSVDTPSLGNLINEGRKLVTSASLRYQLIFPTVVLSIITIAFYIIGNSFADAADPKNHR
ncbi:MAG: ABC transporter permease [Clostridia bacterium]|nr:ABC transporter permease [Clostridia bacterium]